MLTTIAAKEEGIPELLAALGRHHDYLEASGELRRRRRARLRERVVEVAEQRLRTRLWRDAATNEWVDARLPALEDGSASPFAVADELLARSGALLAGESRT